MQKICKETDCESKTLARDWCQRHYNLWRRNGKPERVIGRHGSGLKDPTYLSWTAMTARCSRGKYKGRFSVCDEWAGADGFVNFLRDVGKRPKGTTLDRINNARGYEPNNCRWATPKEQRLNSPQLKIVEYKGKSQPLSEHCSQLKIPYLMTLKRLRRGWSVSDAFELPPFK